MPSNMNSMTRKPLFWLFAGLALVAVLYNLGAGWRVGFSPTPVNIPTPPAQDELLKTRRALFQVTDDIIARYLARPSPGADDIQASLQGLFNKRLRAMGDAPKSLGDYMQLLLFYAEDKRLIQTWADAYRDDKGEKDWLEANMDHANFFIRALVGGIRTPYPDVDSPTCQNTHGEYLFLLRAIVDKIKASSAQDTVIARFNAVAEIHFVNDRGRLARNLELQAHENQGALSALNTTDWKKWRYAALVIVGHSPTPEESKAGVALSQMSKDKIHRAIEINTKERLAPVFIFCGGSVRPQLTTAVEAYNMKQYAMQHFNLSPDDILIDATSEHTYSNFMNAVLLSQEMGVPTGSKMVSFFVPDRYGDEDQYDFTVKRLMKKASKQVFPMLNEYFRFEDAEWERSVEIILQSEQNPFLGKTLLWQDFLSRPA